MRRNKWCHEGDRIVDLLLDEIRKAPTWEHLSRASDAIFHVRLKQRMLEREFVTHHGMATSPWTPEDARPQEGMTSALPTVPQAGEASR